MIINELFTTNSHTEENFKKSKETSKWEFIIFISISIVMRVFYQTLYQKRSTGISKRTVTNHISQTHLVWSNLQWKFWRMRTDDITFFLAVGEVHADIFQIAQLRIINRKPNTTGSSHSICWCYSEVTIERHNYFLITIWAWKQYLVFNFANR